MNPGKLLRGGVSALAAAAASCLATAPPCIGSACSPACPRDAAQTASGRCACIAGTSQVLGACVPPAVADSYCGPAARMTVAGCTFRACGESETLDVSNGLCVPQASVFRGSACPERTSAVVIEGRVACVSEDAKCPRGSRLEGNVCMRPPQCPAGTLPDGRACRPVVSAGPRGERTVDMGAWAVVVLGVDGGLGTAELCRPLAQRPDAFGFPKPGGSALRLRITLTAPDQDLSRVRASVVALADARKSPGDGGAPEPGGSSKDDTAEGPLPSTAQAAAEEAVSTLLEALRGLGGEANATAVKVEVRCAEPER